jgi:hypothetical protein
VGTGKTSLAIEMAKAVRDRGGRVAVIDLDWLAWFEAPATTPQDLDDLLYDNLRAVWANFTVREATHAILTRFVHEPRQLASLRGILQGVELAVGRVVAPPELVERRLRRRDVGLELQEHLGEVSQMNDLLERERIWDLEIVNNDRDIVRSGT